MKIKKLYVNKLQDSFSVVHTETGQGFEFHKGYAYVAAYEVGIGCPNKHQMYCNGQEKTAKIYVYNAKYNSDGKPSPNYGKLVKTYNIIDQIGELETLAFKKDELYLAYAVKTNAKYPFQIFKTSKNIVPGPTYKIKYNNNIATITSEEDLEKIDGWKLSDDKKTLSKTLNISDTEVKICDRYHNCRIEKLNPTEEIQIQL